MHPFLRNLYYRLPVGARYQIRRLIYLPQDLFRKRKSLVPPKGLMFTGSGGYESIGRQFFGYFLKFGDITPESSILDIGSGIGRMAVPFTDYLSATGRYEGFDIVKLGVDWCTKNITSKYPNFNFRLIPLKNDLYHLGTDERASQLVFPYEDDSFDFVFLSSVFTHMMPEDVENYMAQIYRVLKPGKKCFATFFVLDQASENAMDNGVKRFPFNFGDYSLMDKSVREANVAFKKDYLFKLLESNNFEITNFVRGNWSGVEADIYDQHQDIIIFKKK